MKRTPDFVTQPDILAAVCSELLHLAALEEQESLRVAQHTPYWSPHPDSVIEHRAAAQALRADVDRLQAIVRDLTPAPESGVSTQRDRGRDGQSTPRGFRADRQGSLASTWQVAG